MTTFHLTVVTPDGCAFEGQADHERNTAGQYFNQSRRAACMGGMLTVLDGEVRLVATTWEWAEQIDHTRAEAAKKRAEEILARKDLDRREYEMAQARLKRALVRTSIKD